MTDIAQRVAVLEAQIGMLREHLVKIEDGQQELKETLAKYKGTLGGIMFICSAMVTAVMLMRDWIIAHWR